MNKIVPIRSYVRRQGRMTLDQRIAIEKLWPLYGAEVSELSDLDSLFERHSKKRYVEIGFGMGEALLEMAQRHPENDYLGIEVHRPGVGQLLLGLEEHRLTNVKVSKCDAMEVLAVLPEDCLAGVYLFFPDPWLKNRYHKRRLVQTPFVQLLSSLIVPGGLFCVATDCNHYAQHILSVLDGSGKFVNVAGAGNFNVRPEERPLTKFEKRGVQRGNEIVDLCYEKVT